MPAPGDFWHASPGRSQELMTPALNKPVPEFEALATGGVKFTPQAHAGKIVVLYFYPKDNTPGCTTEAMQFRDHYKEFVKAGAVRRNGLNTALSSTTQTPTVSAMIGERPA